ncbi:hypothetical protein C0J52_02620 [Blattella germanica]|nr:hypothetical protein C0J52_02620 [Blattella germanica]
MVKPSVRRYFNFPHHLSILVKIDYSLDSTVRFDCSFLPFPEIHPYLNKVSAKLPRLPHSEVFVKTQVNEG